MTYFPEIRFKSWQLDAFGNQRVSTTGQRLDVEFIYDKMSEFFDEVVNNGTVTHNANPRDLTFALDDANNGSYASMSSHPIPYTPGNSQKIDITGVMNLAGISGGSVECFLRSSISGSAADIETVPQAEWASNKTGVDWTTSHILQMDFQSLKVGTIRFYLVQNGIPNYLGCIDNDNLRDSGYWQLASLPAFWKISTVGGNTVMEMGYGNDDNAIGLRFTVPANASATMKAICCTVKSEGGKSLQELSGLPRSADMGVTSASVSTTLIPLLSIRPRATFESFDNLILAIPKSFNIQASNPVRVVIIHDAVLTGASWADVDTDQSSIEIDIAASAVSGGHEVLSDYVTTEAKNRADNQQGILGKTVLWNRMGSETGILTIAAVRTSGTNADCLTSLQWEEIR